MQARPDTPAPASMPPSMRAILRLSTAIPARRDAAPAAAPVGSDDGDARDSDAGDLDARNEAKGSRPSTRSAARILAAALAAASASACMVGPDFQGATPPPVSRYTR